jgi:hypothetical protein
MAKSRQVGLRLDEVDDTDLRRVALRERRSEQEILRDSLRLYVHTTDEQNDFIVSVERGWYELRSGLGEIVTDDDDFFESVRRDIRDEKPTT